MWAKNSINRQSDLSGGVLNLGDRRFLAPIVMILGACTAPGPYLKVFQLAHNQA